MCEREGLPAGNLPAINVRVRGGLFLAPGRGVPGRGVVPVPRRDIVALPGRGRGVPLGRAGVGRGRGLAIPEEDDPGNPPVPEEPSQAPPNRAGRKRSEVWNFFEAVEDRPDVAVCVICNVPYSTGGGTSNLRDHLQRYHQQELEENRAEAGRAAPVPGSYGPQSAEKKSLDRLLMRFITQDLQATNVVENQAFKDFLRALNPRYKLPTRQTLTNVALPELYTEVHAKIKEELSAADNVAITTDAWSSLRQENYLAVTVHYIVEMELKSAVIHVGVISGSHRAQDVANRLQEVFGEWEITGKVVGAVTDNASVMKLAITLLNIPHLSCVAHTLNLGVDDAFQSCYEVFAAFEHGSTIVAHFKKSTVAAEKLAKKRRENGKNSLRLIQAVQTRWNSRLHMGKRLLEVRTELILAQAELPNAPRPLQAQEWRILEEAVAVLEKVEELTITLSGQFYVTVSKIVPLAHGLLRSLQTLEGKFTSEEGKQFLQKITDSVLERIVVKYETSAISSNATILDPRFKTKAFRSPDRAEAARRRIETEVSAASGPEEEEEEELDPSTSQPATWAGSNLLGFMNEVVAEETNLITSRANAIILLRQYLEVPPRSDADPIGYWTQSPTNPLHSIARKYLCIPATSVPAERLFSVAGQVMTQRRTALGPENAKMLVFLGGNSRHF